MRLQRNQGLVSVTRPGTPRGNLTGVRPDSDPDSQQYSFWRYEKVYKSSDGQGIVAGLVVGVAVGVAIGLLLAPKPGEEARELVRQGIADGIDRVRRIREERQSAE